MKLTVHFLLTFAALMGIHNTVLACCSAPKYNLSELLNAPHEDASIFVCQVDSSFNNADGSYASFATVLEIFREKKISQKIKLNTGGNSSAGGRKLIKGEKYLIFSGSRDGYNFYAFVCDGFSRALNQQYDPSDDYYETVKDYFQKQDEKYTGEMVIKSDGKIYGTGFFKNGKPDGHWKHYNTGYRDDNLRSEVQYIDGKLDGECKYYRSYPKQHIYQTIYFENGKKTREEYYRLHLEIPYLSLLVEYDRTTDGDLIKKHTSYHSPKMPQKIYTETTTKIPRSMGYDMEKYLSGGYKEWDETGIMRVEGQYHLGAKTGVWFYYKSDGSADKQEFFDDPDLSAAPFVLFHPNGKIKIKGQFENGKMAGEWVSYFEDGKPNKIGHFREGRYHGPQVHYRREEGTRWKEENYENGIQHGLETHFQNDGTSVSDSVNFIDGKKEGPFTTYHRKSVKKGFYKNGELHGEVTFYDPEGIHDYPKNPNFTLKIENYENGYLNGVYEEYFKNGQLKTTGQYFKQQKTGAWKTYFENGQLQSECTYVPPNNKWDINWHVPAGDCVYYDESGKNLERPFMKNINR